MKHWIIGTIVLCLTLAASFVTAQDDVTMVLTANIAPSQEIDEQEVLRQMLDDIGVTEAEIMQFAVNLDGIGEVHDQYYQENKERFTNVTPENYVEVTGDFCDGFIQPYFSDVRNEAVNFFTEDQYAGMATLAYQIAGTISFNTIAAGERVQSIPVGDIVQLFLLPDVVSLTEEQLEELAGLQKEVLTDLVGIDITTRMNNAELYAEQEALFEELNKAENEDEKAVVREKISKVWRQISASMQEPMQKAFDKMKTKLDALLTVEQKAKLAQIKQDVPDYLKNAMAKMTKTDAASEAEAPAAWRPGANSWMPGQGAPKDLDKYPREAPRIREPRERKFPGSE